MVVCRTFLLLNGHNVVASQDAKFQAMIQLAKGEIDVHQMADWIRQHLQARVSPSEPKASGAG
jgi:prophage maintenance system killer protein